MKALKQSIIIKLVILLGFAQFSFAQSSLLSNATDTHPVSEEQKVQTEHRGDNATPIDVVSISFEENGFLQTQNLLLKQFPETNISSIWAQLHFANSINQYYKFSQAITPGLDLYTLLFPFHSFT